MNAEQAKVLVDHYARLMEGEMPATVKVLAAVKEETRDYRPDEKSRTAWELAAHIAASDVWFLESIVRGTFTWDPSGGSNTEKQFRTVNEVVEYYKKTYPQKLQELRSLSGDQATRTIDFFGVMQAPAATMLGLASNHGIHHRGQLAAYLRAMGSKVPAIYGGSADEPMQAAN